MPYGIGLLGEKLRQKNWGNPFLRKITIFAIGLILIDLAPATFLSVYRENTGFKEKMYSQLVSSNKNYKVIERQIIRFDASKSPGENFDPSKLGTVSAYADVQSPLGWFHEGSGRSNGFNMEIVKKVQRDINEGYLSSLSAKGMFLLGVKFIIFRDRYRYWVPELQESSEFSLDNNILQLKHASPLIVSPSLRFVGDLERYEFPNLISSGEYYDPESYNWDGKIYDALVKPLIEQMDVHVDKGFASNLFTTKPLKLSDTYEMPQLSLQINEFFVDVNDVVVRFVSDGDGFARIPYTFFPYLDVRMDGSPTEFYPSVMHNVIVPITAGEHEISVRGVASPLRKNTFYFSLLSLLGVLIVPSQWLKIFDRPSIG